MFALVGMSFTVFAFSQQINDINRVSPVNRGRVILNDGTAYHFTRLKVSNDSVLFNSPLNKVGVFPGAEVYSITRTGSYAVTGAVIGGVTLLATGFIFSLGMMPSSELTRTPL